MSATQKLLDKYAAACYARKDKDMIDRLRVKHSTFANWKAGRAHPDAESIEKMAQTIGEPVGAWLASIEAERARNPEAKRVWLRLAAALGTTFAVALTAAPQMTHAAGTLPIVSNYMSQSKTFPAAVRHLASDPQNPGGHVTQP